MRNRLVRGIITWGAWRLLGLAIGLLLALFAFWRHSVAPLIPVIRRSTHYQRYGV